MSPQRTRQLVIGGVCVVTAIILFWAISNWVLTPRRTLANRIAKMQSDIEGYRSDLQGEVRVHDQLDTFVQRSLGGTRESVDHAMRAGLSAIAEASGISDVSVSTAPPVEVESPGRRDFKGVAGKALRDELDFIEVPGVLRGTGSWSEVMSALRGVYAAPWIARVEDVRLGGKGQRNEIDLSVEIRTLFVPGHEPTGEAPLVALNWPPELSEANPFLLPKPPVSEASAAKSESRPDWARWRVSFVGRVEGVDEVWLNDQSGQTIRLQVGQFVEGSAYQGNQQDPDGFDEAVFTRDGSVWLVPLGGSLGARRAISR